MSILQFFRILWARRLLIAAAAVSCFIGAYSVTRILPPRWEAKSRVLLNLLKPDPVSGQVVVGAATRAYVATQTELITDYSVAGQVADQLGWLSDPRLIAQYQARPKTDTRDFRRWLSQIVINNTSAQLVEGSNILEIDYTATNPTDAKLVADALSKAYIDASIAFRRDDATANALRYQTEADKAQAALTVAENSEADFERENGVVMEDDKTDVDSARLHALAAQGAGGAPIMASAAAVTSAAGVQLAQLDAEIAQATQTLGPNHPELKALHAKRDAIASLVAKEQNARNEASSAASAAAASAGAIDHAVETQKARVIAEREKLGRLSQLQSDVNLKKDQYDKTEARAAELRQEAAIADAGITPLGAAATPKDAAFPNLLLIIPGSILLGLATGTLVALLSELFNRRIRSEADLTGAVGVPLLAVIDAPPKEKRTAASRRQTTGRAANRASSRRAARA